MSRSVSRQARLSLTATTSRTAVEKAVEGALPGADVIVHVEPDAQGLELHERVIGASLAVRSVEGVHNVSTLNVDGAIEISLHIRLPGEMQLDAAHAAASSVEAAVREELPLASKVRTHLEPQQPPAAGSQATLGGCADDVTSVEEAVARVVGRAAPRGSSRHDRRRPWWSSLPWCSALRPASPKLTSTQRSSRRKCVARW